MSLDIDPRRLRETLAAYQRPSHARSTLELAITAAPLMALWIAALAMVRLGWWWAGLALSIPAAAFLVRMFMIQHDCGHGAFFRARPANDWTGRIVGALTLTPYDYWRRTHAIHHATSGNLDRRTLGGVETLTVAEYRARPWIGRMAYRFYRHPLVLFGLGPAYMFVLQHRLPIGLMKDRRAWLSVIGNSAGLALIMAIELLVAGPWSLLAVHLPIMLIAATIGVWLFYVQHQFEDAYWSRNSDWTAHEAALRGSSHLDLPPVLRWFTANIGAHHIHHVGSKIPFYRLPAVMRDHPALKACARITLKDAFGCARLALWDEPLGRLVAFSDLRKRATVRA
jgi:omega-6 fatty acid desaturase (delta-12 desaturase)